MVMCDGMLSSQHLSHLLGKACCIDGGKLVECREQCSLVVDGAGSQHVRPPLQKTVVQNQLQHSHAC